MVIPIDADEHCRACGSTTIVAGRTSVSMVTQRPMQA